MKKPNILIILTDQQSYKMLSCAGNSWVSTPNLDALAEEGVRFTNVHCTNPVCLPSRFSLMTGLYPSAVNVRSNAFNQEMDGPIPQYILDNGFAKLLQKEGYQTFYGGKEHLPKMRAADLGFTYYCQDEREILAEESAKLVRDMDLSRPFCMVASFINPHDICLMALGDFAAASGNEKDKTILAHHAQAVSEVQKAKQLAQAWSEEEFYDHICPPLPENYAIAQDEPEAISMLQAQRSFKRLARAEYTDEQWRMHRWVYARLMEKADGQIGQLLDAVKEKGIWDDTVIIFTSDHGDLDASHKMEHKTALYQESVRVPMIVKDTENHTGICGSLVSNGLDLLPTVLDYAGAEGPDYLPGKSFRPCMENTDTVLREHLKVECEFGKMDAMPECCYQLYDEGKNREQFFDRATNPGQMFNQLDDPAFRDTVQSAKEFLAEESL